MRKLPVDNLDALQKTLLIPLKGRAVDRTSTPSLLHDDLAAAVVQRVDYDFDTIRLGSGVPLGIALRSRILDRVVDSFVRAHPRAVVVELGSGLETRKYRLGMTSDMDWYDIDFPDVIALRNALMPEYPPTHAIGASLLDPAWADAIPTDRPTLIVADGLFGFLSEHQNRQMLQHITRTFSGGELVFSAYSTLTARLTGHYTKSVGMPADFRGFGFNDPYRIESLDPRLTLVDEHTMATIPETRRLTGLEGLGARINARLLARWPTLARTGVWVTRYRFGEVGHRSPEFGNVRG